MKKINPYIYFAGCALLALASCNSEPKTTLHSGIFLKDMDTTVSPGNNFASYVNGSWIKNTQIPADKPGYPASAILNDEAQDNVKLIIEEASKNNPAEGSAEQKIGDFYASYMNVAERDKVGLAPLNEEFKKIDVLASAKDLPVYFAHQMKMGLEPTFSVGVESDFKDPKKYMLATWQGGLGLPEREYYLLKDAKSVEIQNKYVAHVQEMFKLAGFANAKNLAATIMQFETSLASKHMKKEDTRNMVALYNKYSYKDLKTLMPDFDLNGLISELTKAKNDTLVVTQIEYTKALNNIIKSTPLDTWKAYFKWKILNHAATDLTSALDKENFNFYSKTLSGTKEQRPQWRRAVDATNDNLGEIVGKVYVEKHFPPAAKAKMEALVKNLLKAYEVSIKSLDWMSPDTKKQAIDKINKFTPKIGYPDKWRDYSALKIVKGDNYGNVKRSTEFEYNRMLAKLGKPVDRTEWGMTPQTVNAYYNPMLNEIVFPAAILQPPFFDMNAEDAINYGGIGAVIGHEIGHGFDDQGSTFDGDGAMRNWWTPKDMEQFKAKTNALIGQYNGFKVFPDLNVNGAFTLGENIGDLGGLSIALKAYKQSLNGKPAPVMDGFTGEQRVFIGWGQVWKGKSREEAARNQVATDPHSPRQFRVNGIVRNIPEFYTAFNIKPTDSLYLAPDKRVKIW